MWRSVFMMLILVTIGCGEELPHPNQQAIDRAEKHADESTQQLDLARQEAKHQQRLRDLDKMTFDSRVNEIEASTSIWKGWIMSLTVLLVIVLVAPGGPTATCPELFWSHPQGSPERR
jgi:hypothetical protein